jgi:N,N'-diacetyllegionaminate synthase
MIRNKTFIIAEAGVNHNGSIEIAKKMIEVAKECGADAIKFQTFKAEQVISKYAPKAEYQKQTTGEIESQLQMLKKLELSFDDFIVLKEYCDKLGIMFLSTPFDFESIDFLNSLGLEIFKIPSGEITNLPYLEKIGKLRKKVILSTGMADLGEIEDALDILISCGTKKENITVLHCNTEYPTPYEDVNLLAMLTIKEAFKVKVGYSDHTLGIEIPIAAVALGASVIEKHFTLDKNMEGPDHKASLEPHELKAMIDAIRNIEKALGNGIKKPSKSELKNKDIARKSIVAKREIKKGEIFTEDNITVKRPGNGISPMRWYEVLGKVAPRDYKEDEIIEI